ncbi:hypothetical protein G5V59_14740 [Nocardioides sp. W3-2-3]|uniref:hypothetical protein n=1 Tax=Nocardioides convexus TaxID=2712224 RepID=UPI0024186205|nr:hypothetical protein [Nocardioides convexus]NHA00787.1 hypothetical protein [Nocardioides convexus]
MTTETTSRLQRGLAGLAPGPRERPRRPARLPRRHQPELADRGHRPLHRRPRRLAHRPGRAGRRARTR